MNYKKISIVFLLLVTTIGIYAFLIQPVLSRSDNEFIVGTAAGYAPFVSINEKGEYEGFDVDVANALVKIMGKKLVLKDLGSMSSLFVALDQGAVDCIIWGLSITQDRLKKVAMVHYQGETTVAEPLIFWQQVPQGVNSLSDMNGMTVCVEPGSAQEAVVSKYEQIVTVPIDKVDDALLNIQYGKVDAAFVEPAIAKKFKNKYPQIQLLNIPLAVEDQVQGVGIVIKKDNAERISSVQQAVKKLKEEGVIAQLEQKWGIVQ